MKQISLAAAVSGSTYPGRGIIIGRSADSRHAVITYFIMGRSVNSRNRVFVTADEGIRTEAFEPAKLTDPSLVIYAPVRVLGKNIIVTNGDQTDTIYEALENGRTFEQALDSRTFEPDAPNFTPRVSGLVSLEGGMSYRLSILKSANGDPASVRRYYFDYDQPVPGAGHFIHTYRCDGNPIPSFEGEPEEVAIGNDLEETAREIWDHLDRNNRVSLFVRFADIATGKAETRIINQNC